MCQDGRFIEQDVGPHNVWAGVIERRARYVYLRGFGPSGPNIRNSCPELGKADVSDVPGFTVVKLAPNVVAS
ncbi:hypothetical protein PIB30_068399 [Stylosanthes scabra]|uniref:Uncharacterized protein n=1 Tax=Stylosanthes scabra TaxID=79078 RepID=A0ABU6WPI8_9FABA|nr:hypothetical protein [Stylosanthes scabra]